MTIIEILKDDRSGKGLPFTRTSDEFWCYFVEDGIIMRDIDHKIDGPIPANFSLVEALVADDYEFYEGDE